MSNLDRRANRFFVFIILYFFLVTSGGCEPLRKKFVRQNKKDKVQQDINPILDPLDYPEPVHSPEGDYKQHYAFWRLWYKDLVDAVMENENDKRQIYLLNEVLSQLEEMRKLITDEKKNQLVKYIEEINKIKQEFDAPGAMRSSLSIKRRLEIKSKKIMDEYNPKSMQNYFVGL